MAKVKVTAKFDILDNIEKLLDPGTADEVGETIVEGAKEMIADGISPVRGHGRFESYKDKDKYPGNQKPPKPVNLNLSGDMLKAFTFERTNPQTVKVGIIGASDEIETRAKAHNSGTDDMAMRRFIPQAGEEWAVSIMRKLREVYRKRLDFLIKQSNKK